MNSQLVHKNGLFLCLLLTCISSSAEPGREKKPLFDGKSFEGWEGDTEKTFRIQDGAVVGGSLLGQGSEERVSVYSEKLQEFRLAG